MLANSLQQQRILVALSHTDHDRDLISYARMLADLGIGRQFSFVHVVSQSAASADDSKLQADIAMTVEQLFPPSPRLQVSWQVVRGVPVDALLEVATRLRSDVILLGHHQNRSGQRSLGRRLAMMGPCSVWMVPEGSPCTISRILAPTDFSQNSADSVATAASIARAAGVPELSVIHVFFDPSSVRYEEHKAELQVHEHEAMKQFLLGIDTQGVHIDERFEEGPSPARTILRVAGNLQSDLLVMNTRGRSRAAAILLGSVTTQLMVETPVPILVTKHFGAMLGLFQVLRENVFGSHPGPKAN